MIEIVVNGVFAENFISTNKRHLFRSFCRTFCIVPFNEGWSIISDMLMVTSITDEILVVNKLIYYVFFISLLLYACFAFLGVFKTIFCIKSASSFKNK